MPTVEFPLSNTSFRITVDHFGFLVKRIEKGDYIDGEELAEALRGEDSLTFPQIFLDYWCRFLAGEVRRPRGRPKVRHAQHQHFGETQRYLEHITRRIELHDYVSGSELADVLRRVAAGQIPDVLLDYLCSFLTGDIKKPQGRRPLPPIVRRQRDMIINGLYRSYTDRLIKRKAREGHAAGWTRLPYPPAELAARIVARYYYYGERSWRSVQTLSSAYRKRRQLI